MATQGATGANGATTRLPPNPSSLRTAKFFQEQTTEAQSEEAPPEMYAIFFGSQRVLCWLLSCSFRLDYLMGSILLLVSEE
ncbi:hypothetical protein L1987_80718 [Smallanthus sonchifolius]|uniref:Uncharacterized protein n=1 Tax=Smallanthus sonchifolius TaxID=185202 RepID=A0ACB8YNM8_9ASTR|nr:hypothetical protein L1987_80718 [Smallanthus sonchifolius]